MRSITRKQNFGYDFQQQQQFELQRTKIGLEKLGEWQSTVRQTSIEIKQQVGRLYTRTSRISKTMQDVWDRNQVLAQLLKSKKSEAMRNLMESQIFDQLQTKRIEDVKKQLEQLRRDWVDSSRSITNDFQHLKQQSECLLRVTQQISLPKNQQQSDDLQTPSKEEMEVENLQPAPTQTERLHQLLQSIESVPVVKPKQNSSKWKVSRQDIEKWQRLHHKSG